MTRYSNSRPHDFRSSGGYIAVMVSLQEGTERQKQTNKTARSVRRLLCFIENIGQRFVLLHEVVVVSLWVVFTYLRSHDTVGLAGLLLLALPGARSAVDSESATTIVAALRAGVTGGVLVATASTRSL